VRIETGSVPTDVFLAEVNSLLRQHPHHTSLHKRDRKVVRETLFEPRKPGDLWVQIIDVTANLLTETEPSRIRKCESCVVHFFDTSKKGSRRWCSMTSVATRSKWLPIREEGAPVIRR
jgi:predicted RNA-binding Zn ribbon-like protein